MKLRQLWFVSLGFCLCLASQAIAKSHHQVGDSWGKERIEASADGLTRNDFIKGNLFAQRLARATAWLTHPVHNQGGNYLGSAHLLGRFEGRFIMMTNSHLVHEKFCDGVTLEYVFLPGKPKAKCQRVFYRNEQLDLAFMEVVPAFKDQNFLHDLGVNISWDARPKPFAKLYTIGFNRHNGIRGLSKGEAPKSPAVAYLTRDDDCRVLAADNRLIRNPKPETENFKPTHSHAFINGCDAFDAGDCGALYVDEKSNQIVGLYWSEGYRSEDVINGGKTYVIDDILGRTESNENGSATIDLVPGLTVDLAKKGQLSKPELWSRFTHTIPINKIKEIVLRDPLAKEDDYACLFQELFSSQLKKCRK